MAAVVDLTDGTDALRRLGCDLLDLVGREDRDDRAYGIYYVSSKSEFAPLCRFVERQVFKATFGNDALAMDREYDPYEAASFFVLAMDHASTEPAGVLRIIRPSGGQKTMDDLAAIPEWSVTFDDMRAHHPDVRRDGIWDIATLAVRPGWTGASTGALVSAALYYGAYMASMMASNRHWVFALDEVVADLLRDAEVPLERVCGLPPIEYLGSPATSVYLLDLKEVAARARVAGLRLRTFVMGEGLDPLFSMPPVDVRSQGPVDAETLEPQGELVGTGVKEAIAASGRGLST